MNNVEWDQLKREAGQRQGLLRPFFLFLMMGLIMLVLGLDMGMVARSSASQSGQNVVRRPRTTTDSPAYGVNFISSAEGRGASEQQYQNGLSTGATWNRWPLYWNRIEQSPGAFSWAFQDDAALGDIAHGLQINAILLGTPPFYTTSFVWGQSSPRQANNLAIKLPQAATPAGLYEPVFDDATDLLGPDKQINQTNVWARFVYKAVNRYKPGGTLAQASNWPVAAGITHWEMWNEPDLLSFWDGTTADYARLLKVGYLAAKLADPNAQILFGGLANNVNNANFYNDVMTLFDADPHAPQYDYFHDILATHNYLYAWRSWFHVWRAGNTLASRGLEKPIWLNESGVPIWDDYPGPICEPDSPFRASMSEQADFIIQSAFYAAYAGADKIFFFQLYDGCGNQPGGTDFTPYAPEMCSDPEFFKDGGDAFGLFRNPSQAACYTQHPFPESPRPGLPAFQLLTTYVTGVAPLWRLRPGSEDPINGPQEWIAFYQPATGRRILGMWSRFGQDETAVVTATHSSGVALLMTPDGVGQTITATNGLFTLTLPAATNQNAIWDPALYPIGGRPLILIEPDDHPPVVALAAALTMLPAQIDVSWSGTDWGSGIQSYDIRVAIDDNLATPWLTATTAVAATYAAEPDHNYTFSLVGRDKAGNVSGETAVSLFILDLPERIYLPIVTHERLGD